MKSTRFLFSFILLTSILLNYLPCLAGEGDDECVTYCNDEEKFLDHPYDGGRLRPDGGVGNCDEDKEVAEDICCCKKK